MQTNRRLKNIESALNMHERDTVPAPIIALALELGPDGLRALYGKLCAASPNATLGDIIDPAELAQLGERCTARIRTMGAGAGLSK
jgi:hypothetical protein